MELEELISRVCERPGMYVGEANFRKAVCFLDGYDFGIFEATKHYEPEKVNDRGSEFVGFTTWLRLACLPYDPFFHLHWTGMILLACYDDADAFLLLPILFREFKTALREAGGQAELETHLHSFMWSFDEMMNSEMWDEPELSDAEEKVQTEKEINAARAAMRGVLDAAARGEKRPLTAHIAIIRTAWAEEKARSAVHLQEAKANAAKTVQ